MEASQRRSAVDGGRRYDTLAPSAVARPRDDESGEGERARGMRM
jgi:hypothetical protein